MCVLEAEPLCWGLDGGHLGVDPKIKIVLAEAAFCNVLCVNERKWAFNSNFYFLKVIPPKGQRYIWFYLSPHHPVSSLWIWAFCFTGGNFLPHVGALVVRWCQANANSDGGGSLWSDIWCPLRLCWWRSAAGNVWWICGSLAGWCLPTASSLIRSHEPSSARTSVEEREHVNKGWCSDVSVDIHAETNYIRTREGFMWKIHSI